MDAVMSMASMVLGEMQKAKQAADALQKNVSFIKEEFEMMQSFLMDVAGDHCQSQVVKTWVRQVRDLAYDGEDCLQEFFLHLEKPLRASSKKLLLPRDKIATQMNDLKGKVQLVHNCGERYRNAGCGLNTAAVQSSISTLPPLNSGAQVPKEAASGNTLLIGREMERSHLIQLISQEGEQPQVISIWGMVGIGKTTLTKSVYESQELSSMFEQRAWVTVLHPFNLDNFLTSFAQQLDADSVLGHGTQTNLEALGTRGLKSEESIKPLSGRRCLIVLDDVLSTEEWKLIKPHLPKESNASRIIVTTSEASVAEHCSMAYKNTYKLEALQYDAALQLFKNKVFMGTSNTDFHPDMTTQAKFILKECDGHPLAIATIGGYLASKPTTAMEWKKLNGHLGAGLGSNPSLEMIRTALAPTYDGLPYHLKLCLLYLSIFPKGHNIRRRRLIRRWIVEGYSSKTHTMSAEENGESYFAELINRSIIRPSKTVTHNVGSIDHCQVHNLLQKIIVSNSMEEKHGFVVGCSSNNQDTIRHLSIISTDETGRNMPAESTDLSHVRSLTVFGEWRPFFISSKMRLLRVLDLEGTSGLKDHDLKQIGNFLHLRFLSLRGCVDIYHLPDSLGDLWDLQTLDVSGTNINKLPKTITKLKMLQYLRAGNAPNDEVTSSSELKESSDLSKKVQEAIDDLELPEVLSKTVRLGTAALDLATAYCKQNNHDDNVKKRDILNKYCRVVLPGIALGLDMHGVEVPDGIGKLDALHTLGVVNVEAGKAILAELEKLTQLHKLGVTGINKKNSQRVLSAIANLALLRSLSMRSEGKPGLCGCLDHKFLPPKHLQSLKLHGNLVTLPTWITRLQNLAKLKLRSTQLEQGPAMQVLGKLPHLAILRLWKESFHGEELVFHFQRETFPSLAVLELASLDGLKSVRFEQGAVPKLELLQVADCIGVDNSGFSGLSFLPSLKEVMLKGDYDNKFMEDLRAQLAQNPIRPVLKAA